MPTATTTPADLTTLSDDALAELLAQVADDDAELARVFEELDRRDTLDSAPAEEEHVPTPEEERRAYLLSIRQPGESIPDVASRYYGEWVDEQVAKAEQDIQGGFLLSKEGEAAGLSHRELWFGNATRAHKYASDELLEWWANGDGRITWAQHMHTWTGHKRWANDAAKAAAAWSEVCAKGRKRRARPGEIINERTAIKRFAG